MNLFREAYYKSIAENEEQTIALENYLKNLKDLDFNVFLNKMKVPSLIPVGSRIMFRGELIHTNEVTVSLGANYFVKCSVKQADVIRQHRIKVAEEKLQLLQKEQEYLEKHLSFSQKNFIDEIGKEIIEPYNENEEAEWRKKHRANVRKHKLEEKRYTGTSDISDNELWDRLEELELKEELENEDPSVVRTSITRGSGLSIVPNAQSTSTTSNAKNPGTTDSLNCSQTLTTTIHLNKLKNCLSDMESKERITCSNEEDVFKRLEQLEEQERLEEEIHRLENEDSDIDESGDDDALQTVKKSITFASDYESDCIVIIFKHSDVSPIFGKYNRADGIQIPRDIYAAFPENFKDVPIPILKKTNYIQSEREKVKTKEDIPEVKYIEPAHINVIGEVLENTASVAKEHKTTNMGRPPSKFKLMRMQKYK